MESRTNGGKEIEQERLKERFQNLINIMQKINSVSEKRGKNSKKIVFQTIVNIKSHWNTS